MKRDNDVYSTVSVQEVEGEADARSCWPVFSELRPHIAGEEEFIASWKKQAAEGYSIAYIASEGEVVAAAGYRFINTMAWGKILYLDDLVALGAHRGRGFGSILLDWLKKKALSKGCDEVHLDTGYQRHAAHKAYLRNGFQLSCHHLSLVLKG